MGLECVIQKYNKQIHNKSNLLFLYKRSSLPREDIRTITTMIPIMWVNSTYEAFKKYSINNSAFKYYFNMSNYVIIIAYID